MVFSLNKYLLLSLTFLTFSDCRFEKQREISKINVTKVSKDKSNMYIEEEDLFLSSQDELSIWTDLNVEFSGYLVLNFKVKFFSQHGLVRDFTINPVDNKLNLTKTRTTSNGKTTLKIYGKNMDFKVPDSGKHKIEVILISNGNESLIINDASLIIRR